MIFNLGSLKFIFDRCLGYASHFLKLWQVLILLAISQNQGIPTDLFIQSLGLGVVLIIFVVYVDLRYILPQSNVFSFYHNPELLKMQESIKRIEEKLKK